MHFMSFALQGIVLNSMRRYQASVLVYFLNRLAK